MNKKIPKVYIKNNKKINNNKEIYYSAKDDGINIFEEPRLSEIEVRNIIKELFSQKDFVYKKQIYIKTDKTDKIYNIVYKTPDYLLTIDNQKIYIKDIIDIKGI